MTRTASGAGLLLFGILSGCQALAEAPAVPGARFDGARALRDARVLADLGPRSAGSDAAARARELIARRLFDNGADVEVEAWSARAPRAGVSGQGQNLVVRIPGKERIALLVSARYDGADEGVDAAGALDAATLLEIGRVLSAGGRRRHDVLLLFTEGEPGQLGARAFAHRSRWAARVRAEIHLHARGLRGAPALLSATRDAGALVARYAQTVERPAGGSFLADLVDPTRTGAPRYSPWPRLVLGNLHAYTAAGGPGDAIGRIPLATARELGQSALDLVRSLDRLPRPRPTTAPRPLFFELPFHILIATDAAWSARLGWLAIALAIVALIRARRALAPAARALPWLLLHCLGALGVMALASGLLHWAQGTADLTASHVLTVSLAGILWLLATQRAGMVGPLRLLAAGLSEPVPLLILSVLIFAGGLLVAGAVNPAATPLLWGPLGLSAVALLRSTRSTARGKRLGAATIAVLGILSFWTAPLDQGWQVAQAMALELPGRSPWGPWPLAATLGALGLLLTPPLAAMTTASVLRPGAGQISIVALVTLCLGIWSGSEPRSSAAAPAPVGLVAVTDARPGASRFLLSREVRAQGRAAAVPWYGTALIGGAALHPTGWPSLRALRAPDGLATPPRVEATIRRGPGKWSLLSARIRPLRHSRRLTIVLPPRTRVRASTLPLVRLRSGAPWTACVINPPAQGFVYRAHLRLAAGDRLGDLLAVDEGEVTLGPLSPRVPAQPGSGPLTRSLAVTPFDTVYAPPPPPPPIPPDIPAPPPAGPEPWWSIMARERYRWRPRAH